MEKGKDTKTDGGKEGSERERSKLERCRSRHACLCESSGEMGGVCKGAKGVCGWVLDVVCVGSLNGERERI